MVDLKAHTEITLKLARHSENAEIRIAEAAVHPPDPGTVLVSGNDHWETYLRIGINPLLCPRPVVACPYSSSRHGSHPILIAAAFQDSDPELSEAFLRRIDEDVALAEKKRNENTPAQRNDGSWWYTGSYAHKGGNELRPERPKGELRVSASNALTFSPSHAEWYTPQALNPRMEEELLSYRAAMLLERLNRSLSHDQVVCLRVKNLATKFLSKAINERAKPQAYTDLAKCARFCHQDSISKLILEVGGALTLLLAFLPEATEDQMVRGLRQLAKSFPAGLTLLPRSPTVAELRKLSGNDAQEILMHLPWEFLESLLTQDAAAVRGLLISKIDDLDVMQRCISNYEKRPKRNYDIPAGENTEMWEPYKEAITRGYTTTRAYREAVELLDVPKAAAVHLLLAHWTGFGHHAPALEWLRHFPDLERPLLACLPPFRVRIDASYKSIEYQTYSG